jgi:hypothetical protein
MEEIGGGRGRGTDWVRIYAADKIQLGHHLQLPCRCLKSKTNKEIPTGHLGNYQFTGN